MLAKVLSQRKKVVRKEKNRPFRHCCSKMTDHSFLKLNYKKKLLQPLLSYKVSRKICLSFKPHPILPYVTIRK